VFFVSKTPLRVLHIVNLPIGSFTPRSFFMKNMKFLGIIALAVVMVFAMVSCDNSGGGGGTDGTVATPTATPAAGEVDMGTQVTLSVSTPGAAIRYTIDGAVPTATTGTAYAGPITITADQTIRAVGFRDNWTPSAPLVAAYTLKAGSFVEGLAVTQFKAVESDTIEFGMGDAPDGSTAFWFSHVAPTDALLEFQLAEEFDRTEYDYLIFDMTCDSAETADWLAGIYTRLRYSVDEDWWVVGFENNGVARRMAESFANGDTEPGEWYEMKIPISLRALWTLHGDSSFEDTVDNFQIMFPFRKDYTAGDFEDKFYIKGFRLETDDELGKIDLPQGNIGGDINTIKMDSTIPLVGFEPEGHNAAWGTWGVKNAPNGDPGFYFADRAPNDLRVNFVASWSDSGNLINVSAYDYLLFDITADTFEHLDWIAGVYTRLRRPGNWLEANLENNGLMRAAIDSVRDNFDGQWVTVKIPVSERAGRNPHDGNLGNPAAINETGFFQFMFPFRDDYDESDRSKGIYFQNLRLEKDDSLGGGNGGGPTPLNIIGFEHEGGGHGATTADGEFFGRDKAWSVTNRAPQDVELNFVLSWGDRNQMVDMTAYDYLLFDITADSFKHLDWIAGVYTRLRRPGDGWDDGDAWIRTAFENNPIMRSAIDSVRPGAPFTNQWVTVKIPISEKAGWNLHDGGGNQLALKNVGFVQLMFPFRGGDYDDANKDSTEKLYFSNFRLEVMD